MLSCADTAVSYVTPQTDSADSCQPDSIQNDLSLCAFVFRFSVPNLTC